MLVTGDMEVQVFIHCSMGLNRGTLSPPLFILDAEVFCVGLNSIFFYDSRMLKWSANLNYHDYAYDTIAFVAAHEISI